MKILLLAPHPFFQERGTPIAVDLLLRALSERGEIVDVLTYPEGSDRQYPGVTIRRLAPIPGIRDVGPGFSVKKALYDVAFMARARRMLRGGDYDAVHAVEEAAFMAAVLCPRRDIPFIFDMDSSIPDQVADKVKAARCLLPCMRSVERFAVRRAHTVVPMCEALADTARRYGAGRVTVLHDISMLEMYGDDSSSRPLDLAPFAGSTVMYVGNLEPYQGIDLLLRSFAAATERAGPARLVIIGGNNAHIALYRELAQGLAIADAVHFAGPRPVSAMRALFEQADALVSPRTQGTNTPMKIYSYLDSGKPILATRLPTHTQVLNEENAMLAEPDPASFGAAMAKLMADGSRRDRIAANAREAVRRRYSPDAFRSTVNAIYDSLPGAAAANTSSR